MNETTSFQTSSPQQRESDIPSNTNSDSSVESYQHYARSNLPEGYTPYKETGQNVYDRYDSDYEASETVEQEAKSTCTGNESCCKLGWLEN